MYVLCQVFLFELIHPDYHNVGAATYALMLSLGGSTTALLGAVNPQWRFNMAIMTGIALMEIVLITRILPESPSWLMRKGKEAVAEAVLRKMRDETEVSNELEKLKDLSQANAVRTRSWGLPKPPSSFYFLASLFFFIGWSGFTFIALKGPEIFEVN